MNEVFNSAARLSGDPLFTLRVSRAMAPEDYGPWAEFALAAPTLRNAIHHISGLATLQTNSMKFGISDDGHQVFWSFEYPQARGLFVEHHALHVLIPLVGAIRRYAGVAAHPSAIHLPLPRTLALRRVEEAIEVPVVAGADAFGIMFPSQWLAFRAPPDQAGLLCGHGRVLPETPTAPDGDGRGRRAAQSNRW